MTDWDTTDWPPLPYEEWEATLDTLHLWTQMVGKTALALTPPENHWWHATLRVSARGLLSQPLRLAAGWAQAEFDFVAHELVLRTDSPREARIKLAPRGVADFYHEYLAALQRLGAEVRLNPTPQEFDDPTPFDRDEKHRAYDPAAVERLHQALLRVNQTLRVFRSRFTGKCSPVQFFWGSFDLAVTRFCGRLNPSPPPGPMMREAYSQEVISCGFWPGDRRYPRAAFYSYTLPAPEGLSRQPLRPPAAGWNDKLGEFIFDYDQARQAPSPHQAVLDFCQSSYEAGATLAHWDRARLEASV